MTMGKTLGLGSAMTRCFSVAALVGCGVYASASSAEAIRRVPDEYVTAPGHGLSLGNVGAAATGGLQSVC